MYQVIEKPKSEYKNGFYWYSYCLNNPLRFTDHTGFNVDEEEDDDDRSDIHYMIYGDNSTVDQLLLEKYGYMYYDAIGHGGYLTDVEVPQVEWKTVTDIKGKEVTILVPVFNTNFQESFNTQLAANAMLANSLGSFEDPNYKRNCGAALRDGLIAGNLDMTIYPDVACGYKKFFSDRNDFHPVQNLSNYSPIVGDIVVFDCNNSHKSGHVAMWCGTQWVSDVKQGYILQSSNYKQFGSGFNIYYSPPPFTIFRYSGTQNY